MNTKPNTNSEANRTLEEIADMMDITRERVRQIETKALIRFRQKLASKGITKDTLEL
ncbi:sigma factor-like helix-turn-helix DNA-binding protein [Polynucleobacter kasalickyi]|uniref:Sigma-70, region 4 n=1 Tax=Polynucleobacter kasalickyi TaxID=1938817 RepID=A0A1W2CCZ0_9BURK|nr:sigma factor-like helix-turn-helix DNA-binding protein [Polynucleobacter kasalickyi]SMC83019.1 Sigma-70, region 4 [Polynucleobacter kasalickyi]